MVKRSRLRSWRAARGALRALLVAGLSLSTAHTGEAAEALGGLQPLVTTSELIVGRNRFAFGLLHDGRLLDGADVTVRVYELDKDAAQLTAQHPAPYRPLGKTSVKETSVHRHADGSRHVHSSASDVRGLYVTELRFSRAGQWGLELEVKRGPSALGAARLAVDVLATSTSAALGTAAPRSRNLIASDVKHLREIDSSAQPDARLHQTRIADAVAQGKPQLIVFATPQFCTSRMCGPVLDIVRSLIPAFGQQFAFIHQEIWQDFAAKKAFATVDEWRLASEPWVFIVDGAGLIRHKYEGLLTLAELEAALQDLAPSPSRRR